MLPIYKALSFDKILEGGSTHPWLVVVRAGDSLTPYVVKLYKKKDIDKTFSVAKDVFCSILAKQFELDTPDSALIEFTDSFIRGLPIEIKAELDKKDSRIKFGCQFIEGSFQYLEDLHRDSLKKYQVETIYAFDNLIKNSDRRIGKSNILLKGTNSYLIDHELTFTVNSSTIEDFKKNVWIYFKSNHIFYKFLSKGSAIERQTYFQDFEDSLNGINFDVLDSYNEQLINLGHHTEENYSVIKEYLCFLKQNSKKFVSLLRADIA